MLWILQLNSTYVIHDCPDVPVNKCSVETAGPLASSSVSQMSIHSPVLEFVSQCAYKLENSTEIHLIFYRIQCNFALFPVCTHKTKCVCHWVKKGSKIHRNSLTHTHIHDSFHSHLPSCCHSNAALVSMSQ